MNLVPGHRLLAAAAPIALMLGAMVVAAPVAGATSPSSPSQPGVIYVSNTSSSIPGCSSTPYSTIQPAIDAARPGQTVFVCPGTYPTTFTITKSNVTVTGAGSATVIDPTSAAVNAVDLDTEQPIVAIAYVPPGVTGANVTSLTIRGTGLTNDFPWPNCTDDFIGVLYQRSSGSVVGDAVDGIALPTALYGCQDGNAIYVQTGSVPSAHVSIELTSVAGYDKNAITCNDSYVTCTVLFDSTQGNGPTSRIAQNGIQVAFGAVGTIAYDSVSGNESTVPVPTGIGTGVLVFGGCGGELSAPVDVVGNVVSNNDIGIYSFNGNEWCNGASTQPTDNVIAGNVVSKSDGDTNRADFDGYTSYQAGIVEYGNGDTVEDNVITGTLVHGVDTAYGPEKSAGGPYLVPITATTTLNAHFRDNVYDGKSLTATPPRHHIYFWGHGAFGFSGHGF